MTERTVADFSRDPRAVEILKEAGINHCCGAHLTLTEGAAAAGIALAPLLARLEALLPAEALDVRGLEPPEPMVRILARLDTMAPEQTLEVVHDRHPIFLYPQLDARGFAYETDEEAPGRVLSADADPHAA
jgi:tRNA 2-thiouridine synthesizing protein A